MKRTIMYYQLCVFLSLILLIAMACKKEDENSENSNLEAITDKYAAEDNVQHIADRLMKAVFNNLPNGTYTNQVVNGVSGTATISGNKLFQSGIDCGYDCVKSQTDYDLTIVFANYNAKTCDNCDATISGTVHYSDNRWSRQSGLNYSSGGTISCSGNNITFKEVITSDYNIWGYSDIISFSASGGSTYKLSGWLTASNGETYNF